MIVMSDARLQAGQQGVTTCLLSPKQRVDRNDFIT